MLDVALPAEGSAPPEGGAFRACLASVLELPVGDVPGAAADLDASVGRWRTWLAGRGCGLVPVANAARFQWAGFWVAVLGAGAGVRERSAVLMFGTPPGVVLSPQNAALLGRAAANLPVEAGYVVAAFDPARPASPERPAGPAGRTARGRVELIAIADTAEAPMRTVPTTRAIPGRGLEGDRYARHAGTFSPRRTQGVGYDLTLIEAEVLDALTPVDGERLADTQARRNLVTRGIDLNGLVGRRFQVGDAVCIGRRLCEPCAHLERLTRPGVLRSLIHKGGLRADILTGGAVREGSAIQAVEDADGPERPAPGCRQR